MTNSRVLYERRYAIRAVIMKTIDDLADSEISNIDEIIANVEFICKEAIVNTQSIDELRIPLFDDKDLQVSILIFNIDWNEYNVQVSAGDKYINLDRHLRSTKGPGGNDGSDVTLKSISETVDEIRKVMRGLRGYIKWRSAGLSISWSNKADDNTKKRLRDEVGLEPVTEDSQKKDKDFW